MAYILLILVFCGFMFVSVQAYRYRNPYKLYMCFGKRDPARRL